jgi:hypothetical protein
VQAGLISCHAGPAHLSRFAVTRRQQHPSSRFPSPVPERRRHHPCCRCRHHTTPHQPTPQPLLLRSTPPQARATPSFLAAARNPDPDRLRLRAAASRAQCPPSSADPAGLICGGAHLVATSPG